MVLEVSRVCTVGVGMSVWDTIALRRARSVARVFGEYVVVVEDICGEVLMR